MPDDLDPTGVRALLANLPDPGPMPDDLVARIGQSLALEQQRRSGAVSESEASEVAAGSTGHPFSVLSGGASERSTAVGASAAAGASAPSDAAPGSRPEGVTSLDAERQRRRPGRTLLWLGGAAAVAMFATVGANQLLGDGSESDFSAAVPGARDSADDGADAGGAPAPAGEDAEAPAAAESDVDDDADANDQAGGFGTASDDTAGGNSAAAGGDAGSLVALVQPVSGIVTLTDTELGTQVSEWLASTPDAGSTTWTTQQAADCIGDQGLDVSLADEVLVTRALWEQDPVMLLVASHEGGGSAWILSSDCDEVVTGPVSFD